MAKVRLFNGKPIMVGKKVALSDDCCCGGPVGACCIAGICGEGYTEAACITAGGTWQGAGTDCDPDPCQTGACCNLTTHVCTEDTNHDDCVASGGIYLGNGSDCVGQACDCCPMFAHYTQLHFSGQVLGCAAGTIAIPEKIWTKVASGGGCALNDFEFAVDSNCLCTFQAQNCIPFTEVPFVATDEIGNCADPGSFNGCVFVANILCSGAVTFDGSSTTAPICCDQSVLLSSSGPYDLTDGAIDVTIPVSGGISFRFLLSLS